MEDGASYQGSHRKRKRDCLCRVTGPDLAP